MCWSKNDHVRNAYGNRLQRRRHSATNAPHSPTSALESQQAKRGAQCGGGCSIAAASRSAVAGSKHWNSSTAAPTCASASVTGSRRRQHPDASPAGGRHVDSVTPKRCVWPPEFPGTIAHCRRVPTGRSRALSPAGQPPSLPFDLRGFGSARLSARYLTAKVLAGKFTRNPPARRPASLMPWRTRCFAA